MITVDTITDAQIRWLRATSVNDGRLSSREVDDMCKLASYALDDGKLSHRTILEARARCAEILNTEHASKFVVHKLPGNTH